MNSAVTSQACVLRGRGANAHRSPRTGPVRRSGTVHVARPADWPGWAMLALARAGRWGRQDSDER